VAGGGGTWSAEVQQVVPDGIDAPLKEEENLPGSASFLLDYLFTHRGPRPPGTGQSVTQPVTLWDSEHCFYLNHIINELNPGQQRQSF
jgi:hypothetical protein